MAQILGGVLDSAAGAGAAGTAADAAGAGAAGAGTGGALGSALSYGAPQAAQATTMGAPFTGAEGASMAGSLTPGTAGFSPNALQALTNGFMNGLTGGAGAPQGGGINSVASMLGQMGGSNIGAQSHMQPLINAYMGQVGARRPYDPNAANMTPLPGILGTIGKI